ncbi:MAG: glycosyltransferase, partial [Verrucomicrobiota bacterium]
MPTISVIIPTLNEADDLKTAIRSFGFGFVDEIIVVDGGSDDETREVAAEAEATVASAPEKGRAKQLNHGVSISAGDWLLFSHADTVLNESSLGSLRARLEADSFLLGGAFARRFSSTSLLLRGTSLLADWRGRVFGWFLGDQSLFARRTVFEELGGFDEAMGPGEDLDFSVRMATLGKTALITPPITSSARRFESRGPLRQT